MRVVRLVVLMSVFSFVGYTAQCEEKASKKEVSTTSQTIDVQKTQSNTKLDRFGDIDGDGIINLYDLCPCQSGEKTNTGCPDERTNLKIA
ncbi:hypothetical protein [Reichenbachiella versicolor]|uniref:hypothetical protein n=1 Tax=Reichenbachiella versicolor TaxID=1821036 RepID=UPI000D6E5EFB|nr:hypothetical protein [Reichenbachiella versicolor]